MSKRSKKNRNKMLAYFNLEQESKNAVQLILKEGDVSPVWFPLSRVDLKKEAMLISGPKRFMEEKVAESKVVVNVEKVEAAKKIRNDANNTMVLLEKADWENEKSIGIDCSYWSADYNKQKSTRVFFPKSKIKDGCVPQWLLSEKIEETRILGNIQSPAKVN